MTPLPWHEPLVKSIRARIAGSMLPHALLLTGPEGWGEGVLANWLALEILGVKEPRDASTLAHPDLRWVVPEGAMIKVDMVREVAAFAHGTPQAGAGKVAVLADAHYLNVHAANALLKTLEEPPPNTHLLLYSSHPGRLLPTIRSRCQTLVIRPDPALARAWLERHADVDDLERRMLEHGGAPLAVMAAMASGEAVLEPFLEHVLDTGASKTVIQELLASGLAPTLARWYRYVLALAAGHWQPPRLIRVPRRALMDFAEELSWARRQLVTSNSANERLLAERIVALWRQLGRMAS